MAATKRKRTPRTKAANAWKDFYNSPEGRLAIGALLARFDVFGAGEGIDNPTSMAIAHGQREVCAWIAEQIGMKAEKYVEVRNDFETLTDRLVDHYGAM